MSISYRASFNLAWFRAWFSLVPIWRHFAEMCVSHKASFTFKAVQWAVQGGSGMALVTAMRVSYKASSQSILKDLIIVADPLSVGPYWILLGIFGLSIALFGVRRGLKIILSHRAPSNFNMSSYRTIWTHFKPNCIFWGQKI